MSVANQSIQSAFPEVNSGSSGPIAQPPGEIGITAKPSRYNLFIPLVGGRSLAYNTVSQAFAIWSAQDRGIYDQIEEEPTSIWDSRVKAFLYGGFVVCDTTDELKEQELRYNGARLDPARMTLTVAPTMACNFGCDYCFQGSDKPTTKMSQPVQDAFVNYLEKALEGVKLLHIAWYGGEPLLGIDIIESLSHRVHELCRTANVNYNGFVVTNGYALNRNMAEKLVSLGITSCQITLDGAEEFHDQRRALLSGRATYRRIIDNMLEWINDVSLSVSVRVNIDDRNEESVIALLEDLRDEGFANRKNFSIYFAPVEAITEACHGCDEVTLGKKKYADLETSFYRVAFEMGLAPLPRPPVHLGHCQAIRPNGLLLLPNGDLHKCWDTVHDAGLKVGSIFAADKVPNNPLYKSWIEWSPFKNNTCRSCKILPNCAGACAHKFVNAEVTKGEAGSLPCPSWKFNIAERLLLRAEKMNVITRDDIPPEFRTSSEVVGKNHTFDSVRVAGELQPA